MRCVTHESFSPGTLNSAKTPNASWPQSDAQLGPQPLTKGCRMRDVDDCKVVDMVMSYYFFICVPLGLASANEVVESEEILSVQLSESLQKVTEAHRLALVTSPRAIDLGERSIDVSALQAFPLYRISTGG